MKKILAVSIILVSLFFSLYAGPNEDSLFDAIDQGDLSTVTHLVEKGADVNAYDDLHWTPLVHAVRGDDAAIVEFLLKKGASPNQSVSQCPLPGCDDTTVFAMALGYGNRKIIDLMIRYGADKSQIGIFSDKQLMEYLQWGKLKEAEELLISKKASLAGADTLQLLLLYDRGSEELRSLIRTYGPASIADGTQNLLDFLVPAFDSMVEYFGTLPFPMATTHLYDQEKKIPRRYDAVKAFDGDLKTSWVEGVAGAGVGQKIAFIIEPAVKKISIVPGYADGINFTKNNRVRRAELSIYLLMESVTQLGTKISVKDTGYKIVLDFKDAASFQDFDLKLPKKVFDLQAETSEYARLLAVLEIKDVYKGSAWDDTCIAEIKLY
jgi:hypothetical protein